MVLFLFSTNHSFSCRLCKMAARYYLSTFSPHNIQCSRSFKNISPSLSYIRRWIATVGTRIVHKDFGDPREVLSKEEFPIPTHLPPSKVLIEMLAAPINPADINSIQGVYGIKPNLPAIAGNEGVARVLQVGSNVTSVTVNDWVIPTNAKDQGTWTSHAMWEGKEVIRIPNDIPLPCAATISVNPCTAYRLLRDFAILQPGDVILQNGGNSAVGQAVIQLAKQMGIVSVNVVRERPNFDQLKDYLMELGATHVITESALRSHELMSFMKSLPPPKLGLNCVGGKPTTDLIRFLGPNSVLVTYGAMARQPVIIGAASLIFKDISVRGFWLTRWKKTIGDGNGGKEWKEMVEELSGMCRKKTFLPPLIDQIDINDFKTAVNKSMEPFIGKKIVLMFKEGYK